MGQVHQATSNGKKLAVKIQYPGVGDTIKSDLAMVKPIALRMFKINPTDYNEFIQEVQVRLMEEADYTLELKRSVELSRKCSDINNLVFPTYYPQWSSPKILTMDWIEGVPLGEFLKRKSGTKKERQVIGQAMWDFYHYQIHTLKALHADPHPGNFIITPDFKLGVIDFGCVKVIPPDFYKVYFQLLNKKILKDKSLQDTVFKELRFIYEDDSAEEKKFFTAIFQKLVELLSRPFREGSFNFADKTYFEELYKFGADISGMKEFRESTKARGVKDALYINRTYYGLYNLLHELEAEVDTSRYS
jgi:predicted unusual protein kinase regulating ubiquinone biosynthesis (AarF/ABC1/UbiB family)